MQKIPCIQLLFTVILSWLILPGIGSAWGQRLVGPVDLAAQWREFSGTQEKFTCATARDIPASLQSIVFYRDSQNSIVDPELERKDRELLQAARDEEDALSKALVALIRAPAAIRGDAAGCAVRHLLRFAEGGAFLQTDDRQGSGAVRLYSVTPTLVFLALRDAGLLPPGAERQISGWIGKLAVKLEEYEAKFVYTNNISDWTMAGLALAAVALDDRPLLERAIAAVLRTSRSVSPEGTLAQEMARGDAAMVYSLFGAQALAVTVVVARANGRDLLAEPDGAGLARLFRSMNRVVSDPAYFVQLGGTSAAAAAKHLDRQNLGFLIPYYLHSRDAAALRTLCTRHPESWRIGGDWYVLFAANSWCGR